MTFSENLFKRMVESVATSVPDALRLEVMVGVLEAMRYDEAPVKCRVSTQTLLHNTLISTLVRS